MGVDIFTDVTSKVLAKSLDATAARQKTIANNIANVETPGYRRSYINFESELRRILDKTPNSKVSDEIDTLRPTRNTDIFSPGRQDGNNVNIDAEMSDLAKNTINYRAVKTLIDLKISGLRNVIREGR